MNDTQWHTVCHCVSFNYDALCIINNHNVGSPLYIEDACSQHARVTAAFCFPPDRRGREKRCRQAGRGREPAHICRQAEGRADGNSRSRGARSRGGFLTIISAGIPTCAAVLA